MAASRQEVLERKRSAYVRWKQGEPVIDIAKDMKLSERMVYRYIDEYELVQLRKWKTSFQAALDVTPLDAPVSQLLKVLKAKK